MPIGITLTQLIRQPWHWIPSTRDLIWAEHDPDIGVCVMNWKVHSISKHSHIGILEGNNAPVEDRRIQKKWCSSVMLAIGCWKDVQQLYRMSESFVRQVNDLSWAWSFPVLEFCNKDWFGLDNNTVVSARSYAGTLIVRVHWAPLLLLMECLYRINILPFPEVVRPPSAACIAVGVDCTGADWGSGVDCAMASNYLFWSWDRSSRRLCCGEQWS